MEELREKVSEIERIIHKYMPTAKGYASVVLEAMNYAVDAGGKRLRPMLMLETYRKFAPKNEDACSEGMVEPFLAAIEMIHTYSLIHDDLPALDNDDLRRGKPTVHKQFGEDMAILAGDGLLNYAYETAAKAYDFIGFGSADELSQYRKVTKALQVLAKKPGIYGMVGGQTLDVAMTGRPLSEPEIDYIYENKTGALIEASMMIGAILAGADAETVKDIERIGSLVGLAFQIQDDILDIIGDEATLGKPIHSDEELEKVTYVTLRGLEKSKEDADRIVNEAVSLYDRLEGENAFLRALLISLIDRKY